MLLVSLILSRCKKDDKIIKIYHLPCLGEEKSSECVGLPPVLECCLAGWLVGVMYIEIIEFSAPI